MGLFELLLIAVGLSMDAFAVSVCKGLSAQKLKPRNYLVTGAWFGGFQALMPAVGYLLGSAFGGYITAYDHWIAFVLLLVIGAGMLKEGLAKDSDGCESDDGSCFSFKAMLPLAVATSIDALAVGVTLALLHGVNIVFAVFVIGATTFVLSATGLKAGSVFGLRCKNKAELVGGAILILIGIKILLEHLGVLNF